MDTGSATPSSLAGRLLLARQQADLTTREVSQRLKPKVAISHATIANYEKGKTVPTIDVLLHLAALYGLELGWFMTSGPKLSGVQFRKLTSRVKVSEEESYKAAAQRWLEAYVRLEKHLGGQTRPDWRDVAVGPKDTGETLAVRVRRDLLKLGDETPVPSVIEVIEERFGVRVLELGTAARIDGFAAMYGEEPVIVLNPTTAHDRARLNAGHELGHILFGDCRDGAARNKGGEDRGFEFAVNLLLPTAALHEAFRGQSMVKLVRYKELFGISLAAMVYRAEKVSILTKKQATGLWIEFSKRGWRQNEPGQVRADRAIRFERLYEEAIADNRLDPMRVSQIMGVREEEMRRRVEAASGASKQREADEDDDRGDEISDDEDRQTIQFPR